MDLWDALDLDAVSPPVVAIAGGGGKTALLYRLGREAASSGRRAVLAGTARFTPAAGGRTPPLITADEASLPERVAAALLDAAVVVATPGRVPGGRLAAVSVATADALAGLEGLRLLALEADGSKLRPFKAPGEHEPVVPPSATHVVTVVGADAIDAPLDARRVHRPERVRAIAGRDAAVCDVPLIARVVGSTQGGRKGVGERRFAVVVNKADLAPARTDELARALRAEGVPRVIVASLRDDARPVIEVLAGP